MDFIKIFFIGCAFFIPVMATAVAPAPQDPSAYHYQITRNGKSIGAYGFEVSTQGAERQIRTKMNIKVKVLFVTAYKAYYEATSVYKNNTLSHHKGYAKYNGKVYKTFYNKAKSATCLQVNDAFKDLAHQGFTLQPFWVEGTKEMTLISAKGRLKNIIYQNLGEEAIKIAGKTHTAKRAKITGEVERDLWYGPNGVLLKAQYKKDGAIIRLIRQNP